MRPLRNNVLLAELKKKSETESGIILTSDQGKSQEALVVGVGSEVKYLKLEDTVIPDWSKGSVCTVEGIQCVVISEDDILAVIE
jgi:chaperonin GroES